ncbi:MAG: hypothetical protein PHT54_04970 [Candidatus Nanoarchaeia archaeon]|nr:hypothetical protein [Candidatus Nanoarchaeia archaeon]
MIIAFSGMHGTGKTTHIEKTEKFLRDKGYKTKVAHIINLSLINKIKKAEPEKNGLNKEFGKWYFTLPRIFIYVFDLIVFYFYSMPYWFGKKKVLLLDRYFYDRLANFNTNNFFIKLYIITFRFLMIKPLTFFFNFGWEKAYERKPEYKEEFFAKLEKNYHFVMKGKNIIKLPDNDQQFIEGKISSFLRDSK